MKTQATKNTSKLFKLAIITSLLSLSVINVGCTDQGSDDKKQESAEESKKDDKKTAEKGKDKKKEKPPIPVEVVSVTRGDIQKTYRTITTLEAESDAQVVARSTGILQDILVEEGDRVSKGQLLAQLDVEQLSLEVAQLEATSNKLLKELTRQQALFNKRLGSSDSRDRAKFEFESQKAQLKLSKLRLEYASIKAPIDGIITERLVKPGNLIRDTEVLFKIVDPQSLKAVLHLPEKELRYVKKQQQVMLGVDALEGEVIQGEVERIRPSIDTQTGTFKVVASLDDKDEQLRAGMFGKVEVVFDVHQNTLLLAQETVITQDNRSHVFIVKDNKAIQTPVKIGFRHDGIVEVTDGLSDSDQVISTGQQILKHESIVEVVNLEVAEKTEKKNKDLPVQSTVAVNP